MPLVRLLGVLIPVYGEDESLVEARELKARAAKLRMLQYLSEPPLPFLPKDAAA